VRKVNVKKTVNFTVYCIVYLNIGFPIVKLKLEFHLLYCILNIGFPIVKLKTEINCKMTFLNQQTPPYIYGLETKHHMGFLPPYRKPAEIITNIII
jgi:hypothetical protein